MSFVCDENLEEEEGASFVGDADESWGRSDTHHLVPARLVRIAHRLKQLDESDDSNTIQALSRMKLPQMTGQVRDVEQRALELQRAEGREEFRVWALHHNLQHHVVPVSVATARQEAPSSGMQTLGTAGLAGALGAPVHNLTSLNWQLSGSAATGGGHAQPHTSSRSGTATAVNGHTYATFVDDEEMGDEGRGTAHGAPASKLDIHDPTGSGPLPLAAPPALAIGGGASSSVDGGGVDAPAASLLSTLSHTEMRNAEGGGGASSSSHSLSDSLSRGASSTIAAMLAAGTPAFMGLLEPPPPPPRPIGSTLGSTGARSHTAAAGGGASPAGSKRKAPSSLSFRVVPAAQLGSMRHSGSAGSATTITMRGGLCDVQLSKHTGAAERAVWEGPLDE